MKDELQRINPAATMATVKDARRPTYYDCGICGALHDARWDGDCRQDSARFDPDQLDAKHGVNGWDEIGMEEVGEWRTFNA